MTPPIRMGPVEDLLFYKLKDLILEQSEGEWTDEMIVRDAHHFADHIRPLLTAAPVREEGGAVGPGGWLIREADGGWLWTGHRIAATAALTEGHEVVSLSALAGGEGASAEAGEHPCYGEHHPGCECVIPTQVASPEPSYLARLSAKPKARDGARSVCLEIPLSNHMKVTLEYDPDGSRTAMLWNEANEPIADGEAPALTTQPAPEAEKLRAALTAIAERVKTGAHGSPVQALGALSDIEQLALAALQQEGKA